MAAIVYECVTGQVPFKGNNGPSILLEILTKEPMPPSQAGAGQKYPVPPTLDHVMAHALKKAAATRIGSLGALADAMGGAYGLQGTHLEWAATTQQDLGAAIQARLPEMMAARPTAPTDGVADSFFGESAALDTLGDPFGTPGPAPAMAQAAYPQPYPNPTNDAPAGLPKPGLGWLIFALVGGAALLLGIVIVLVVTH